MARGHRAHRWRIASRCPRCQRRLLSVCAYRTCSATRDDRPVTNGRHVHVCRVSGHPIVIDLPREARRIFADMLAPAREIGL